MRRIGRDSQTGLVKGAQESAAQKDLPVARQLVELAGPVVTLLDIVANNVGTCRLDAGFGVALQASPFEGHLRLCRQ